MARGKCNVSHPTIAESAHERVQSPCVLSLIVPAFRDMLIALVRPLSRGEIQFLADARQDRGRNALWA